jgi:dTDP-4-amino-4,6-dideoxygalactose transaminase
MTELQHIFGKLIPHQHCTFTGSGTTAIYLALKALGLNEKVVCIPNNVCYSVPIAVLLSGNKPFFIDVEEGCFGLSPDDLQQHMHEIDAVIAVHAYGNVCDIDAIQSICKEKNIPLIEDCATALGSRRKGVLTGGAGDISIYSFGAGKIIDIDHGGAISTNNSLLAEKIEELNDRLPPFKSLHKNSMKLIGSSYKKYYNSCFLSDQFHRLADFMHIANANMDKLLFQFYAEKAPLLKKELNELKSNIAKRRKNAELFQTLLSNNTNISVPLPEEGTAIWRFNAFIERGRNELFKSLINKNYKLSTWFPSISQFFSPDKTTSTPNSDWVGDHILNLWVNADIDDDYIHSICNDILKFNSTHNL